MLTATTGIDPRDVSHPAFNFDLEILSRIPPWPGFVFVDELADDLGLTGPEVTAAIRSLRDQGYAVQRGKKFDETDPLVPSGRSLWLTSITSSAVHAGRAYVKATTPGS